MSDPTIHPQFSDPEGAVEAEPYQLRAPEFRPPALPAPATPSVPAAPSAQPPYAGTLPPEFAAPSQQAPDADADRVVRGIMLSLAVIPVGVIIWVALWNAGFIASIVSFGVALGAVWLYRLGSRGARVTRGAFWAVIAVVVVTVALSFLAGIYSDLVAVAAVTWNQAITSPAFWATFWDNIFNNAHLWEVYAPQLGLAVLFAALGCFGTIRRLARESRA